jgi:hypothetical protein
MQGLRDRDIFRFCAIPQIMSIGTLAQLYNNGKVFEGAHSTWYLITMYMHTQGVSPAQSCCVVYVVGSTCARHLWVGCWEPYMQGCGQWGGWWCCGGAEALKQLGSGAVWISVWLYTSSLGKVAVTVAVALVCWCLAFCWPESVALTS